MTVSSASVRPSDSTSAPARPSDSEILTVEDPRYRHSDPELPPTDDRRSPAAHLSDIMTGTETPKMWLPFMVPAVDPDAHPFGTLQKQDPHRLILMPDTTTLPGIDHTRDRDHRLGTVILGTEPYLHLSLVHLNLVRLEPRLAHLPPLLLELLQSCIKARPSR
ncbi:UNVERIFIED_CONTAM: hypothetical protein K2H54_062091 [Gekko kuhli]